MYLPNVLPFRIKLSNCVTVTFLIGKIARHGFSSRSYTCQSLSVPSILDSFPRFSSGGGLVLQRMIKEYKGSEVFQPIINGIGGNLVSVQASRMSTMLHQSSIMGILPLHGKIWVFPWTALFIGCTWTNLSSILSSRPCFLDRRNPHRVKSIPMISFSF